MNAQEFVKKWRGVELKERTLTNLYNERLTWLQLAPDRRPNSLLISVGTSLRERSAKLGLTKMCNEATFGLHGEHVTGLFEGQAVLKTRRYSAMGLGLGVIWG